jgi:ornithine cyclodeaminase/alanine dehydrogenase-like protein (mu-crystallin family)
LKTTIYSSQDIVKIVKHLGLDVFMDKAIASLTKAFAEFDQHAYEIPIRDGFEYHHPTLGLVEWMPTMKVDGHIVLKIVGYHPSNPTTKNLPSVLSTSFSIDTQTGHVTGIMDSTFTTAIRTAAASAIASRALAKSDASTLGLIGCGAQAVSQLHALSRVMPLTEVLLFDTDLSVSQSFTNRVAALGLSNMDIKIVPLEELVSCADVICTTTSVDIGLGPVFNDHMLKPHAHINAVGSDFPGKVEVPVSVLKRSLVCPDFLQQAMLEGECQQLSADMIGPDIAKLVQNGNEYEKYQNQTTVFDSTGWALEDFVMNNLVAKYASELNCGTEVDMTTAAQDCKDPYGFLVDE